MDSLKANTFSKRIWDVPDPQLFPWYLSMFWGGWVGSELESDSWAAGAEFLEDPGRMESRNHYETKICQGCCQLGSIDIERDWYVSMQDLSSLLFACQFGRIADSKITYFWLLKEAEKHWKGQWHSTCLHGFAACFAVCAAFVGAAWKVPQGFRRKSFAVWVRP